MAADPLRLLEELRAIAQAGLEYGTDAYDRQRYQALEGLYQELLAAHLGVDPAALSAALPLERGYATPKLDVRGAVFARPDGSAGADDDQVLLVKERADGRWTLPGGWADIGRSPADNACKEILEESGYHAEAVKLVALYDRDRHGHPPSKYHTYKALFLCRVVGGAPTTSLETEAVEFFPVRRLPPLSLPRTTGPQIDRCHAHFLDPALPTDFD
jgi:ADP-ribose pyrophosphatase YjhB (NUDIX family)